jgi:hypothetical protein
MEIKECRYHPGVKVNCPGVCEGCWCEPEELVQERQRAEEAALKEQGYRVGDDDWDGVEMICVDCGTAFVMAECDPKPRWCPGCGRIFGKPRTREELLKAMSREELAERLLTIHDGDAGSYCRMKPECVAALEENRPEIITDQHCLECVKAWLMEEV